jgi:hypothetical protein
MRHIETLSPLALVWRLALHAQSRGRSRLLSRLSKLREYCGAISVPVYRVMSVTRDARDGCVGFSEAVDPYQSDPEGESAESPEQAKIDKRLDVVTHAAAVMIPSMIVGAPSTDALA